MKPPLRPLGRLIREVDLGIPAVLCPHCGSSMLWKWGILGRYMLRHFGSKPLRCIQDECVARQKVETTEPILHEW